jgi:uncharacterized membrane protein YvlD (DUF360 family)
VIRLLVRLAIAVAANAVGLIVAASLLDGMHLNGTAFVVSLIIFTVVFGLLQPFLLVQFRRSRVAALGGISLIATFVALLLSDLLSDGLSIEGAGTWIAATVLVWLVTMVATLILPFLGLKKFLEDDRGRR